jgi:hypothetical protein
MPLGKYIELKKKIRKNHNHICLGYKKWASFGNMIIFHCRKPKQKGTFAKYKYITMGHGEAKQSPFIELRRDT